MGGGTLLELAFPARPEHLGSMRERLGSALGAVVPSPEEARLLVLAVNEACMNVIQHGYRGDPRGEIVLQIFNNDGELEFRLRDYAEAVDPDAVKPRPLDRLRPGGLGTHFIREIMDDFHFRRPADGRGNLLIMRKLLGPGEASRDAM